MMLIVKIKFLTCGQGEGEGEWWVLLANWEEGLHSEAKKFLNHIHQVTEAVLGSTH